MWGSSRRKDAGGKRPVLEIQYRSNVRSASASEHLKLLDNVGLFSGESVQAGKRPVLEIQYRSNVRSASASEHLKLLRPRTGALRSGFEVTVDTSSFAGILSPPVR